MVERSRLVPSVIMFVAGLVLLYVSIAGLTLPASHISLSGLAANRALVLTGLLALCMVMIIGLRKLRRLRSSTAYESLLVYEVMPLRREGREEEFRGRELVSFLLGLSKRGLKFALSVVGAEPNRPFKAVLVVDAKRTGEDVENVDRIVTSLFRLSCPSWSISRVNAKSLPWLLELAYATLDATGGWRLRCSGLSAGDVEELLDSTPLLTTMSIPERVVEATDIPDAEIPIGVGLNLPGTPRIGLRLSHVERHVAVFGATGYGKTTTATIIALGVSRLIPYVIILDWHDEYQALLARAGCRGFKVWSPGVNLALNPFDGRGALRVDPDYVVEVLEEVLDLTPPQSYYLHRLLSREGSSLRSFDELLDSLEVEANDYSYSGREARMALLRKLYSLSVGEGARVFSYNNVADLLKSKGINIVRLGLIKRPRLRRTCAFMLLKMIIDWHIARGHSRLYRVVVVDEAQNLFHKDELLPARMLPEVRKYGLGFIIVSQSPSSLASSVMENTSTRIVHALMSGRDKQLLREIYDLPREYYYALSTLRRGEALLFLPEVPYPLLVKVAPEPNPLQPVMRVLKKT